MSLPLVPATPSIFMANLSLTEETNSVNLPLLVEKSCKIDAAAHSQMPARTAFQPQRSPNVILLPPSSSDQEFVMHQSLHSRLPDLPNVSRVYSRNLTESSAEATESLTVMSTGKKIRSLAFNSKVLNGEQEAVGRKRARSLFDALKPTE